MAAGVAAAVAATLALGFVAAATPRGHQSSGRTTQSSITVPDDGANADSKARYTGVPDLSSRIAKMTRSN